MWKIISVEFVFPCHFCKFHINIRNLKWHSTLIICRQWTLVLEKKSESGMTLMYLKKTLFKNKVYECY